MCLCFFSFLNTDKTSPGLSQLKVGFHANLQSELLANDGKAHSPQTATKTPVSDHKQDPSSGLTEKHRVHPGLAEDSGRRQSVHIDVMTSGSERPATGDSQTR